MADTNTRSKLKDSRDHPNYQTINPNIRTLIFVVVLVVIAGIIGLISGLHKDTLKPIQKTISATVPSSWAQQPIADFHISVSFPAGWSQDDGISTFNSGNDSIRALAFKDNSTSIFTNKMISITEDTLAKESGQIAFEKTMADPNSGTTEGIYGQATNNKAPMLKTTILSINGKRWLQRDLSGGGVITRIIYRWDSNHAIGLSVTSYSNTVSELNNLTTTYLYPAASSLTFTD